MTCFSSFFLRFVLSPLIRRHPRWTTQRLASSTRASYPSSTRCWRTTHNEKPNVPPPHLGGLARSPQSENNPCKRGREKYGKHGQHGQHGTKRARRWEKRMRRSGISLELIESCSNFAPATTPAIYSAPKNEPGQWQQCCLAAASARVRDSTESSFVIRKEVPWPFLNT
jgi:hypothetical protein